MVAINAAELRRRRQMLGDNQAQFARRCNISAPYVSQIESGKRRTVSPGVYVRICDALDVQDRKELLAVSGRAGAVL
jgi:transcriptional regulator with XRE-family HTH domain